jgi:hypothetical protein
VVAALEAAVRLIAMLAVVLWPAVAHPASDDRFGPYGDVGVHDLWNRDGLDVHWRSEPLADLEPDGEPSILVIDTHFVAPSVEDWEAVVAWVEVGGWLVLAGYDDHFEELGGLVPPPDDDEVMIWTPLYEAGVPSPVWPDGPERVFGNTDLPLWVGVGEEPVAGVIAVIDMGEGTVLAISDARILYNGALVHSDNERFASALFGTAAEVAGMGGYASGRIELVTTSMSSGADSPTTALNNAHLLPFVLQLLVFWAVVVVHRGWAFGPSVDPPEEGRWRFADHADALADHLERTGASGTALGALARLWLGRLGPSGVRDAAIAAGKAPDEALAWVARLEAAAAGSADDRVDDLEMVEELWRITRR